MRFDLFKRRSSRTGSGGVPRLFMKGLRAAVATVAAVGMMAGAAMANSGGAGSGEGGAGTGDSGSIVWTYRDGDNGSFGDPTSQNVRAAISAAKPGVWIGPDGAGSDPDTAINQALDQAIAECSARGNEQCRLVGVGFVWSSGTNSFTGAAGGYPAEMWQEAYGASNIPSTTWSHNGIPYMTNQVFSDGKTSVNSLANREMTKDPTHTSVIVIILGENEPPVQEYDLTVTTDLSTSQSLQVGAKDRIVDVIHADNHGSSIKEELTGTAIVHFDGNAYVPAAEHSKTFKFANSGDTTVDLFAPSDFGWEHWPAGTIWVDVQVAKQGKMKAAVDTADRDPRETLTVTAVPPTDLEKTIEQGVSADSMVNRTVITTGTGRGGYAMTIKDVINPNGVDYEISNMKVVDKTDNNKDISDQFTMSWDKASNTVSAVRSADKGELPMDHQFEFSFDVTVHVPEDYVRVQDHAELVWNDVPTASTDTKEFPTWQPNPDKSWIKQDADGKWQAVIDPQETNQTGADRSVFLDGDKVASVVNGTWTANAIDAPTRFALTDDWTAADYIWDGPTDAKDVRVYAAEATSDRESSVVNIVNKGEDVTKHFDIKVEGTTVTASAKAEYLETMKGMDKPMQYTLLVPGVINFANGGGAAQVRADFGKQAGDELTFCAAPDASGDPADPTLTNKGSQTVNDHTAPTNEPWICGYVPPVVKDVIGEASEGGDQSSVDGMVVHPGQKVEYQLTTQPNLPGDLAYGVSKVVFTDSYDQWLSPDKQTVEMMDLSTGRVVPKSKYSTEWDEENHLFRLTVTDGELIGQWRAGGSPRLQVRFEGTVAKDAPTDHKVNNKWVLTLNNSLTPSNEVFNIPPDFNPSKEDNQSEAQGDPTVNIDGKTLLLGDTGNYVINLDLMQKDQAYDVWRAGITDDYDDAYLEILAADIEVIADDGQDVTDRFNVAIQDGVAYVYAKTVDTQVLATGETVPGDPQPTDLKAYAELSADDHDPLTDPAIDQTLLGHTYEVILPYTVIKVDDGYVVENTATQVVNDTRKDTNMVSNPLKPINPVKDVTVEVGGDSANGQSIYLGSTFLYQLDSSILPADRAYPTVEEWGIDDQLDPKVDVLTGQWAVYATRDLYKDGEILAKQGQRIAGSGFDSSKLGGDMFTATLDPATGKVVIESTELYRQLVSADTQHEQGWRAYIQVKRAMVTDRHENVFTERYNGKEIVSNVVWTKTPDMTPSLKIEKWDEKSGFPKGDRDTPEEALKGAKDGDVIVFTITNTSKTDPDTGEGAWFKASDLELTDETIVGDGKVTDLTYPDDWDTLILKPGDSVDVKGTLTGFTTENHTDRAQVTGTPLVECPVTDDDPFGDGQSDGEKPETVEVDGKTLCKDTKVDSNTDDWNATSGLASTGSTVLVIAGAMILLTAGGVTLFALRRRTTPAHSDR